MPTEQRGSNAPSNDLSADWLRQIRQQARKCDEETGVLRNLYKRAKSDGMNVGSMRQAIKSAKLDRDEVATDLSDQLRYMSILRVPISAEEIFDWDAAVTEQTARADDMWDASDKGYHAGRHGVPTADSPYEPGTELFVSWLAAWREGQAAIAREMGKDVEPVTADRSRPQRTEPAPAPESEAEEDDQGGVVPTPLAARAKRGRGRGRQAGATAH